MKHLLATAATVLIFSTGAFAAEVKAPTAKASDAQNLTTQTTDVKEGDAGVDASTTAATAKATDAQNLQAGETATGNANVKVGAVTMSATSKARDAQNLIKRGTDYDQTRTPFSSPAFTVDGFGMADAMMSPSDLAGAPVYGASGDEIGEVEMVIAVDGKINRLIIGVGGFLGLGEKDVNVNQSEFAILSANDGDDVRVYVNATQAELEAQPSFSN
jgi:sporulation protein YlmC with PRC-barrel domain